MSEDMDSAVTDALGQYQCIAALTAENERLRRAIADEQERNWTASLCDRLNVVARENRLPECKDGPTACDLLALILGTQQQRVAEPRRALERYGSHDDACSQAKLDAAFAGTKQPACTCGLNAALEDKP